MTRAPPPEAQGAGSLPEGGLRWRRPPLLQIPASSHYQVDELREQLLPLLARTTAPVDDLRGERREPTFSPLLLDGVDLGTSHPGAARKVPPPGRRGNARVDGGESLPRSG
jgi:hypothetical protein